MMIAKRRKQKQRRRRGGYVLVLVVLLLFGIMAMAALVIDIGFARLTQRQMQTAVDAASLEGLRYRDSLWPEAADQNSVQYDLERRNAASLTAARMFDDNLLADDADPWNFGAGPVVEFSGGAGDPDLVASQFMTIPDPPVYKPNDTQRLRNNSSNAIEGDMLEGQYAMSPDPTASSEEIRDFHMEENDYSRKDFPMPATSISPSYPAFLVRMRRSNESFAGSDTASNGPALPYLFARGSLFNRSGDPTQAKLSNGIQVRATGIAHAQPVVCIGAKNLNFLRIAVDLDLWTDGAEIAWATTYSTVVERIDANGDTTTRTGHVVADPIANSPNSMPPSSNLNGLIALFSPVAGNRIIGFGYAQVTAGADLSSSRVSKIPFDSDVPVISTSDTSAVFCSPMDTEISATDMRSVFQQRTDRFIKANPMRTDILLAPVSGR